MSLIPDTRWRAIDSSGNPMVGATLTIYDTGTTTPAAIYRNAALSTPMTNPTVAPDVSDSGGWFPQIFAAEDGFYDITLKTSGGVTVKTYVNVPAIGSSATTISRDYGNSRMKILGSGGTVYFEAGDPSGDDTGGKIALTGWNATQADTAVIDAAATTITGTVATTGALAAGSTITEAGKSLVGVSETVTTFAAAASVAIPLTNNPSGVRMWDIDIIDIVASGGSVAIDAVFSFDGGSTYATAGNYNHHYIYGAAGSTVLTSSGSGAAAIQFSVGATAPKAATIRVITPASTGITYMKYEILMLAGWCFSGSGYYNLSSARATHVKLTPASGTIAGTYRVIPQRGF